MDYLDLYFCHRPDPDTPVAETVFAMDAGPPGKVLYWGTSEWPADIDPRCACHRPRAWPATADDGAAQYNLLHRERVEREYTPLYRQYGHGHHDMVAIGFRFAHREVFGGRPRRFAHGQEGYTGCSATCRATRARAGSNARAPLRVHRARTRRGSGAAGDRVVPAQPECVDGDPRREPGRTAAAEPGRAAAGVALRRRHGARSRRRRPEPWPRAPPQSLRRRRRGGGARRAGGGGTLSSSHSVVLPLSSTTTTWRRSTTRGAFGASGAAGGAGGAGIAPTPGGGGGGAGGAGGCRWNRQRHRLGHRDLRAGVAVVAQQRQQGGVAGLVRAQRVHRLARRRHQLAVDAWITSPACSAGLRARAEHQHALVGAEVAASADQARRG